MITSSDLMHTKKCISPNYLLLSTSFFVKMAHFLFVSTKKIKKKNRCLLFFYGQQNTRSFFPNDFPALKTWQSNNRALIITEMQVIFQNFKRWQWAWNILKRPCLSFCSHFLFCLKKIVSKNWNILFFFLFRSLQLWCSFVGRGKFLLVHLKTVGS